MKLKKLTSVFTAMIMAASVFMIPAAVSAESDSEKLANLRKEIEEKKEELEIGKDKEDSLFKELSKLEVAIADNEQQLVVLEKELEIAEEKVETQTENLNSRLRNMYKSGSVGFLDVLLDSSSFSEFLTNLDMVEIIHSSDQELLTELEKAHDEVEAKKNEVETMQAELKESQKVLEAEKAAVEADIEKNEAMLDEMEENYDEIWNEINKKASSSSTSTYSGGSMAYPAPACNIVTSKFGWRTHPVYGTRKYHRGIDLAGNGCGGTPIVAANDGKVITSTYHYSYGNYVVVDHGGGVVTLYAHARTRLVSYGEHVSRGQQIATVGTTGTSTGNHLHFEVQVNGQPVNPASYIGL